RREVERAVPNTQTEQKLRSTWLRINPTLIPGRITNPDAKEYAFYDWPAPGEYQYKLESVSISGQREEHEANSTITIGESLSAMTLSGLNSTESGALISAPYLFKTENVEHIDQPYADSAARIFHLTPGVAIEDMTFEGTLTSDWGHNNSKPVS